MNDIEFRNKVYEKYEHYKNITNDDFFNVNQSKLINVSNAINKGAIITIFSICVTGIAYAGNIVIEKVFKEPKLSSYNESISINENEKVNLLSEEKIENLANKELIKLNKQVGNIKSCDLYKDPVTYEIRWRIWYDNQIDMSFNAITGNLTSLCDFSIDDTKIKSTLSEEEAKKIGEELYLSLGYKKDEYVFNNFTKNSITDDSNLCQIEFSKKYGDIFNEYQTVRISFIPEKKQIVLLNIFDYEFDNNEQVITKEQAIEIAKNKDISLYGEKENAYISAKLSIEEMNSFVYGQEHPIDFSSVNNVIDNSTISDYEIYVVEPKTRLVWKIIIDSNDCSCAYFVDCTTGEIIGGDATR